MNLFFLYLIALLVAIANIALNIAAQSNAKAAGGIVSLYTTSSFLVAFAVGSISLTLLNAFYFYAKSDPNFGLAQALLVLGAVSIGGGIVYGVLVQGNRLTVADFLLLLIILGVLLFRIFAPHGSS